MSDINGQCLCGAVEITLNEANPRIDICHCAMYRRWGGGPFFGVMSGDIAVTGEQHVTSFASSDRAERAFCSKCGSHLWYKFLPTGHRSVLAGLFDMSVAEIEQQIFVDEKPAYYDFAQQTPTKTGAEVVAEAKAKGLSFGD